MKMFEIRVLKNMLKTVLKKRIINQFYGEKCTIYKKNKELKICLI